MNELLFGSLKSFFTSFNCLSSVIRILSCFMLVSDEIEVRHLKTVTKEDVLKFYKVLSFTDENSRCCKEPSYCRILQYNYN